MFKDCLIAANNQRYLKSEDFEIEFGVTFSVRRAYGKLSLTI